MPVVCIEQKFGENTWGTISVTDLYFSEQEYQKYDAYLSIRGGTSRSYDKHSYKVVLKKKKSLLGMRVDNDWVLNAMYDDAGLIHNKFSYDVVDKLMYGNEETAQSYVQSEYVEVFYNQEYVGVYLLSEKVDKNLLSLGSQDILYKCPDPYAGAIDYEKEDYGISGTFEIKTPVTNWEPLVKYIEMVFYDDMHDEQEILDFIDIESFIDYNIFCLLASASDNLMKNTFFLAEYADGEYLMKKVLWDFNVTWGNVYLDKPESNFTLYTPEIIDKVDTMPEDIKKLYELFPEKISSKTRLRWNELRKEEFTFEKMKKVLDKEISYLHASGAYERNYLRWTSGVEYWNDNYIYEYLEKRLLFLDDYFNDQY